MATQPLFKRCLPTPDQGERHSRSNECATLDANHKPVIRIFQLTLSVSASMIFPFPHVI
jgi:hypothetical protein